MRVSQAFQALRNGACFKGAGPRFDCFKAHKVIGIPNILIFVLAAAFGVFGLGQLGGPQALRRAYDNWDYPQHLRVVTGLLDVAVALMLAEPNLRAWGIALAAILSFGSVVTLLNHRQYAFAAGVILMMVALIPATLAIPRANQFQFIAPMPHLLADTR